MRIFPVLLCAALCWTAAAPTLAQAPADGGDGALRAAVQVGSGYRVHANVTYLSASGQDPKLDVYQPWPATAAQAATPVVLNIHGGGWVVGAREDDVLQLLPYMQMGFAVVNVDYRLARTAPAPAALEDTLCALQWVGRNAQQYNFDLSRIVVTGGSAGGHLALATSMLPADSPYARQCAASNHTWAGPFVNTVPKVAAVINWFGITDVADMLEGPNVRSYAVAWFGGMDGRMELARRISPVNHVRKDGPPVLTIHGDNDALVPLAHALRLKQAMDKAGQKNQLLILKGAGHGGFTVEQNLQSYVAVRGFLRELGIGAAGATLRTPGLAKLRSLGLR